MNWITSWFAPKEQEEKEDTGLKAALESYKFTSEDAEKLRQVSKKRSSELLKMSEDALDILDKIGKKK